MREIKFRGQIRDDDRWVYGNLTDNLFGEPIIVSRSAIASGPLGLFGQHSEKVIEQTIGQFAGISDKNGKEAYEDDLVRVLISPIRCGALTIGHPFDLVGRIVFNSPTARWLIVFPTNEIGLISQEFGWAGHEFEVIGNAHEHPSLLNNQ